MTTTAHPLDPSVREPLTGLYHDQAMRQMLRDTLVPQALDSGYPLSVALVDIDNFAGINEAHGRACGDAVLQIVARALTESLPDTAFIARWGGDEFCVALPDTRLDDTFTLLEDLRRHVTTLVLDGWPDVRLTCSAGLASVPANGNSDVELLRAADQALYVAKVTGRNKAALPLADNRMVTKTSYYTTTQLERLSQLARRVKRTEATILREALDDVLKKYNDLLGAPPKE